MNQANELLKIQKMLLLAKNAISGFLANNGLEIEVEKVTKTLDIVKKQI